MYNFDQYAFYAIICAAGRNNPEAEWTSVKVGDITPLEDGMFEVEVSYDSEPQLMAGFGYSRLEIWKVVDRKAVMVSSKRTGSVWMH